MTKQDKARIKAQAAAILDHFKLTLAEYAQLTDRQIQDLYFHARDEHGGIKTPDPEPARPADTLPGEMAVLDMLLGMGTVTPEQHRDMARQLKIKYGEEEDITG